MSRLIDADELKRAFIGNRYGTKAIEYVIDNAPTIKAIPTEWIERKLAEHWYVDYDIRELLDDWEEENE